MSYRLVNRAPCHHRAYRYPGNWGYNAIGKYDITRRQVCLLQVVHISWLCYISYMAFMIWLNVMIIIWRVTLTPPLIGWVPSQDDPWTTVFVKSCDSFTRVIHNQGFTWRRFPHYWRFWRANNAEFWYFCNWSEWTAEWTVGLLMMWDTMSLM